MGGSKVSLGQGRRMREREFPGGVSFATRPLVKWHRARGPDSARGSPVAFLLRRLARMAVQLGMCVWLPLWWECRGVRAAYAVHVVASVSDRGHAVRR